MLYFTIYLCIYYTYFNLLILATLRY
jgi:hypothetical protein